MRFRGSVAIDLGTVNTLVWVAGRGIVLEEPTAIAIDTAVGKVAAGSAACEGPARENAPGTQVASPRGGGDRPGPDHQPARRRAPQDGTGGHRRGGGMG